MNKFNNFLEIRLLIDSSIVNTLNEFYKLFSKTGNNIKVLSKNDLDQVNISIIFSTPDAIIWIYKWIHDNLLDGKINPLRDNELQWLVGTNDFVDIVYQILYKKPYQNNSPTINEIKY